MKKLLTTLLIGAFALTFVGCESKDEARAIIGHSYQSYSDSSNWETVYFSSAGTVQLTFCNEGTTSSYTHITYKIKKCNVEMYYDYNSFWKESARGQLLGAFTYMPEQDCLIGSNNGVYVRIN
jgi:uncharacterized lipoprotein NlpE involved in copper resistance